jgi:hypothetical protein
MSGVQQSAADLIKSREIWFSSLHHDPDQAGTAMKLLEALEPIKQVARMEQYCLYVEYSIADITLKLLEDTLRELGFHLGSSLLIKLKRALFYYMEDTQCINLGICHSSKDTEQLFISEFQRHEHGCRDDRPTYLRNYR